jgi:hypothetical protein
VRDRYLSRVGSPYLGIVSVVTAAVAVGYILLLAQQGDWPGIDARQTFVLMLLGGFVIVSAIGAFAHSISVRVATAAACTAGLLPLGFLALFSIGLPIIVAGALALVGWLGATGDAQRDETLVPSALGALTAIAILAVGLAVSG